MLAQSFWKLVVADQTDFLDRLLDGLSARGIRFCVLGGKGMNAYVDPVVSLDLAVVIATDQGRVVEDWVCREFRVEAFPHSLNVSSPGSDFRVQIQLDPRYESHSYPARTSETRWAAGSLLPALKTSSKAKSGPSAILPGGPARDKKTWPTSPG